MNKNMNKNFEITVDEMTEMIGDTPVEMSFREVKEGMDSFFGLMGMTMELLRLYHKESELKKHHRAYRSASNGRNGMRHNYKVEMCLFT